MWCCSVVFRAMIALPIPPPPLIHTINPYPGTNLTGRSCRDVGSDRTRPDCNVGNLGEDGHSGH